MLMLHRSEPFPITTKSYCHTSLPGASHSKRNVQMKFLEGYDHVPITLYLVFWCLISCSYIYTQYITIKIIMHCMMYKGFSLLFKLLWHQFVRNCRGKKLLTQCPCISCLSFIASSLNLFQLFFLSVLLRLYPFCTF